MKKTTTRLIVLPVLLSALTLTACSQQKTDQGSVKSTSTDSAVQGNKSDDNVTQSGTIGAGGASGVDTSNSRFDYLPNQNANNDPNNTNDLTLAGLNDPNNLLSKRIIYFDYNKAGIRPEYMILINTHAKLAAKYPQLKMRLEGHADERGSREYNVALSEQRSQSVKRIMGTQGARSGQIQTIGYGEEVPIVRGHDQDSWQQNRRVEIKYENY